MTSVRSPVLISADRLGSVEYDDSSHACEGRYDEIEDGLGIVASVDHGPRFAQANFDRVV